MNNSTFDVTPEGKRIIEEHFPITKPFQRRIKPLTGQVLVEILPADTLTAGGIEIPERHQSPEEVQMSTRRPEPPAPWKGKVVAVGPWPKLKCGMLAMPEFGVGQTVLISHGAGTAMQRDVSERFRMVAQSQVLAILEDSVEVRT